MTMQDRAMDNYNYWNDSRVRAAMISDPYRVLESNDKTTKISIYATMVNPDDDDDDEKEVVMDLPTRYEVCGMCEGSATVVNPSIDAGGLTQEDMYERGPEFEEEYFAGSYDVQCPECKGKRVVPHLEFPKEVQARVDEWYKDEADYARTVAMERAMGA